MDKRSVLLCLVAILSFSAFGQTDYKQYYFNGKNFYREGKYNLAMESFKYAIPYDANNPFSAYASFYFSLSAYHQGFKAVARDGFTQLKKVHPNWDKNQEVDFWMGRIMMEERDYFQGLKVWASIKDPGIRKILDGYKHQYISVIDDVETLSMMAEEYPSDKLITRQLAYRLSKQANDIATKQQLEEVIDKYKLNRSDFIDEAPPTYFKDTYSVSVLYPFLVSTLEPIAIRKRNQLLLDFYEGMKQAVDTLRTLGIKLDLRAYDTERKLTTLNRLLKLEEIKTTDVIVGPFFPEENKVVQEFSIENRINVIKPFTNNLEVIGVNEFAYMMQPSYETLARKSAEYAAKVIQRKKVSIFYGTTKKDSIQAAQFSQRATELGLSIRSINKIPRDGSGRIIEILSKPTEVDPVTKLPSQFVLPLDSVGSIYVASDEQLIFSKVVSSAETRGDSILVIGSESWLTVEATDYEKLESQRVVFTAPNYMNTFSERYRAFEKRYIRTHGRVPSEFAAQGYEITMFLGKALKSHGVYFQDGFEDQTCIPGVLTEGFGYPGVHDNQCVPIVRLVNGTLTVVNK